MQIQITARHMNVPDRLKSYIESRVEKLEKFIDVTDVRVTLSSEKFRQIAEVNVHSRGNVHLSATEASEDLKLSLNQAVDKIEAQAKKHRERRIAKKRRRPKGDEGQGTFNIIAASSASSAPSAPSANESSETEEGRVIESRRFVIKPLSVEEAAFELEDEGAEFLVFRNAANERTNVLYKRPDGNYGLIDPE